MTPTLNQSLFPLTGRSPLDTAHAKSYAALAAGSETGASGERLVEARVQAAGFSYWTSANGHAAACRVPYSTAVQSIAHGLQHRVSDGFIPELRLHVEVKSGEGKETDSIDTKFEAEVYRFVLHGMGDVPRPESDFGEYRPIHRLMVFVGKKQYSGSARLAQAFVDSVRSGAQPMTDAQRERAHRYHFVNVTDLTPAYLDRLVREIRRYGHA